MAARGVRSSWLASATNWRSCISLSCRASKAAPTWSSMWLSAAPTWPTSVAGSASGTRSASSTSPRSNGRAVTRRAVVATRSSGSSSRRTSTAPITPATASVIAATSSSVVTRLVTVWLSWASGRPVIWTEPSRRVAATTRYWPSVGRSSVIGRAPGGKASIGGMSFGGKVRSLPPRVRTRASVTWPSMTLTVMRSGGPPPWGPSPMASGGGRFRPGPLLIDARSASSREINECRTASAVTSPITTAAAASSTSVSATRRVRNDRARSKLGPWLEHVPRAPHGVDHRWAPGVDLLAQVGDVELDDVGLAAEVVVPHPVEDLGLGEHALGVAHEEAQQLELGGGELDELVGPADLVAVLIEHEIADDQLGTLPRGRHAGAAQQPAQPRDQLLEAERLRDVVVATRGEPRDPVLDG